MSAKYQRYVFDFFKEPEDDEDIEHAGGYTDKITLTNVGKSGSGKKSKLSLNYFAIAIGATIEMEYDVVEDGASAATYKVQLESGDAFVVNSNVKQLCYHVRKTTATHAQPLVMRPGCLLL